MVMSKVSVDNSLLYSILVKVTQLVGGIIVIKLLSVLLSKNQFGDYSFLMSIVGLLSSFPFSAFNQTVLRYSQEFLETIDVFLSNAFMIYVFFILLQLIAGFIYLLLGGHDELLAIISVVVFSSVMLNFLYWFSNGVGNQKAYALMQCFDFSLKILAIFLLYYFDSLTPYSVLSSFAVISGSIFIYVGSRRFCFGLVSLDQIFIILERCLSYALPILIWSVFVWAQGMSYRWYLGIYSTSADVGSFAVMSTLALVPITSLTGVMGTYLLPKFFVKNGDFRTIKDQVLKATLGLCVFLILCLLIVTFFKDTYVRLLSDEKYVVDSWMLPYMFFSLIFFAVGTVFSYIVHVRRDTKKLLAANIVPGFFALTAGGGLIAKYGLDGAVVSFVLTYMLVGSLNIFSTLRSI